MPAESAVAPPPAAPTAPAAPSAPRSAAAPPEIHVTPTAVDRGPTPEPPKKGSAQQRLFDDLRKKAGAQPEEHPKPPAEEPKLEDQKDEDAPPPEAPEAEKPTGKKEKVSPWKLVDEHKAARLKAEQEIVELRKTMVDPVKAKEMEEKYAAIEKRAKELEEHIKFVDYSKSQDFQDKYQKPYEQAWSRWMGELGDLTVQDPSTGTERPLAPQDILELVNMPLQKAREQAEATFGNFADDVMSARKEIRGLFEAQSKALDEARKGGAERDSKMQMEMKLRAEAHRKEVMEVWNKANQEAVNDERFGKFFKPVEGDEEGNTRLSKGYEMADRAFSVSPNAPNLTPDERASIVRLHAAVRNRAAGFGRVAYQNQLLEAKLAALTEELNKYKGTEPGAGTPKSEKPAGPVSAKESVFAALRSRAH